MVLVDGMIEEIGNHSELLSNNGVYSALVASQQLITESVAQHQQHKADYMHTRSDLSLIQPEGDATSTDN